MISRLNVFYNENASSLAPMKRKRGRPRKYPTEETSSSNLFSSKEESKSVEVYDVEEADMESEDYIEMIEEERAQESIEEEVIEEVIEYIDEEEESLGNQCMDDGIRSQNGENSLHLSMSYSLVNQIRQMARFEGISVHDLLHELIAEGMGRRQMEDSRGQPSHLMTRTGYVPPTENDTYQQRNYYNNNQNRSNQGNYNNQNRSNQGNYNNQNRNYNNQNRNNSTNTPQNGNQQNYNNQKSNPNRNFRNNRFQNTNTSNGQPHQANQNGNTGRRNSWDE